jgi:hypothetical protein
MCVCLLIYVHLCSTGYIRCISRFLKCRQSTFPGQVCLVLGAGGIGQNVALTLARLGVAWWQRWNIFWCLAPSKRCRGGGRVLLFYLFGGCYALRRMIYIYNILYIYGIDALDCRVCVFSFHLHRYTYHAHDLWSADHVAHPASSRCKNCVLRWLWWIFTRDNPEESQNHLEGWFVSWDTTLKEFQRTSCRHHVDII